MTAKWIFFDLDDTLFDFSSASLFALRKLWDEAPFVSDRFDSADAFISEYHIHNSAMWDLHERGLIDSAFLKYERFRLTLAPGMTDDATIGICRELNDRYLSTLGGCPLPCPGAERLLKRLSARYLIGVLTNGFSEVQYRKLKATHLDRYIQRMVISDETGIQKPDPRLFRYAEAATGALPENAVMIGDNPRNDIQGAIDAGWHAIYFDRKGKPFASESELYLGRITDLESAEALLERPDLRM